jgi:multiple sugar transport system permease protein
MLLRYRATPYTFILPAILTIFAIMIIPIFVAIGISFTDAKLLSFNQAKFIGLQNYTTFLTDRNFKYVITATSIYVIGGVALTYIFGLITATILNQKIKGRFLFRAMMILPWVIPQVVLVLIFRWMLNPQYGVINYLFASVGLISRDFGWLSHGHFAILAILMVTLWKQYPLGCLILLAGMKSIPDELYEAASVDGANSVQKFIHITIPGLRYVTAVLILLLVIWSFGNFVIIWLMTQGGPANRTATLTIFTYLNAFKFSKLGYASAIGFICLIVSLVFSVIYYVFYLKKIE